MYSTLLETSSLICYSFKPDKLLRPDSCVDTKADTSSAQGFHPQTSLPIRPLVILGDIHHSTSNLAPLLERLVRLIEGIELWLVLTKSTDLQEQNRLHWYSPLSRIQADLTEISGKLPSEALWIGAGLGARLLEHVPIPKIQQVLCNPTYRSNSTRLLEFVLYILFWKSSAVSTWFNRLITNSWLDILPSPKGLSPWMSRNEKIQEHCSGPELSIGTWKTMLALINQLPPKTPCFIERLTLVFWGTEAPATSMSNFMNCFPTKEENTFFQFFPHTRQEMLLADEVQQAILGLYQER